MKLTKNEISSYLIWVAINLIVLLAFGTLRLGAYSFYPFDGFDKIEDYDFSEFLAYTIVPLLIITAFKLRKDE